MIIGTVFTLFVVPSVYMLVARNHALASTDDRETETLLPEPVEVA